MGIPAKLAGVALLAAGAAFAAGNQLDSYATVKPVLDAYEGRLPAGIESGGAGKWTAWARKEDKAIRARLKDGDLESMVNLLLLGTSFTKQPRILMENITEASKSGLLRSRVDDLVAGLSAPGDNERLAYLSNLLRDQDVKDPGEFLYENLLRVLKAHQQIGERAAELDRRRQAEGSRDPAAVLDRSSVFSDRGIALDTNILPDFSIERALRDIKKRGMLREGQVARVAVVGAGLDLIDKSEQSGYDYYPRQTSQPFALYDSLLRLGLAKPGGLNLEVHDISPSVIDHFKRVRARAAKGDGYVIQLPRDVSRPWQPDLAAYWKALGSEVGEEVAPIRPPEIFKGLETRAVRIRPEVALTCKASDLNIVLERKDLPEPERFDLIVGTNIFIYYGPFEQSLALENAGAMLKTGGLLLSNDRLPEVPGGSMRLAGVTRVSFDDRDPTARDDVGWYRKQ